MLAAGSSSSAPPSRSRRRLLEPGRRRIELPAISRLLPRSCAQPAVPSGDLANFRPATEIYEQNTPTAARRVRESDR